MTDREKWNQKYALGGGVVAEPSPIVTAMRDNLPISGRALDVAGGAGRHAAWMARRGLDVTLVDVSDVAIELAEKADPRPGALTARRVDLESAPLPEGPWDVILVFHYLARPLFPALAPALSPGGLLIYVQPTLRNLERHAKPGPDFLVGEGELWSSFVSKLEIVRYDEGWMEGGRHEAVLLARRPMR